MQPRRTPTEPNLSRVTRDLLRNEQSKPAGKLADAEVHFLEGELAGLNETGIVWAAFGGKDVWDEKRLDPLTSWQEDRDVRRLRHTYPSV